MDDGTRTHDTRNHNPMLCQLNYIHHLWDCKGSIISPISPNYFIASRFPRRRMVGLCLAIRVSGPIFSRVLQSSREAVKHNQLIVKQIRFSSPLGPAAGWGTERKGKTMLIENQRFIKTNPLDGCKTTRRTPYSILRSMVAKRYD